ncbi:helix-turn-helix domain-containing protein [Paraburkholderia sp. BR10882]|uniref:AlbA family DNA-binding domain-containing protein n=1 Tax=unclassified Paraburkholderia TaxID=2615204 RepID=UPI0034CF4768
MIPLAKLEDVNEAIIQRLIDDAFRESRTLDFKAQLDLTRDGKQALAEDVCAFANTVGGDLVFGIREDGGVATQIVPLHIADLDEQLLALTNFLRDAVEPRVTTSLLSHAVPLAQGGHVVVLRVAPSPNRRIVCSATTTSTCATPLARKPWTSTPSAPRSRFRKALPTGH